MWVNCWLVRDLHMPFGGMKESGACCFVVWGCGPQLCLSESYDLCSLGIGREDAVESLRFFSDIKTVCIKFAS